MLIFLPVKVFTCNNFFDSGISFIDFPFGVFRQMSYICFITITKLLYGHLFNFIENFNLKK